MCCVGGGFFGCWYNLIKEEAAGKIPGLLFLEVLPVMNPYSYNPTGYGMGYPYQTPQMGAYGSAMMQPGMMQNAPQTVPQQPQSAGPAVMQVSTTKQVEQVQVQPGGKALVLVANEPVIAMRMADNMGLTTTDYYHIEKFDPDAAPAAAATGDFVPRAEFDQAVQTLANAIQQLQQAAPATQAQAQTEKGAKA